MLRKLSRGLRTHMRSHSKRHWTVAMNLPSSEIWLRSVLMWADVSCSADLRRSKWRYISPKRRLTYGLANSMELNTNREATSCAVTQEPLSILWNPKVHYRNHKSSLPVLILSQVNPVHTTPSYLSKIYLIFIHPNYILFFWKASFHLASPPKLTCVPLLAIRSTCPANLVLLHVIILIIFGEESK
jgi:hypothetical protein